MTAKKQNTEPSFEQGLERLEALAETMESGELSLDALLTAYAEGAALAKAMAAKLDNARARLNEVKAGKDGSLTVTPSDIAVQGSLLDDPDVQ